MAEAIDSLMDALKTGDIVLFGPAGLTRFLPRWLAGRRWKHVGLVVRDAEHGEPMLWETAPAGAVSSGVRLRRLAKRLRTHAGRASVRRLNRALSDDQCTTLAAWRRELEGRQRRRSLVDLMGAGDDGWVAADHGHLDVPLDGELVADGYQRIGLLDGVQRHGLPADAYTAHHFAERESLRLRLDYALGPEIPLAGADQASGSESLTEQPA